MDKDGLLVDDNRKLFHSLQLIWSCHRAVNQFKLGVASRVLNAFNQIQYNVQSSITNNVNGNLVSQRVCPFNPFLKQSLIQHHATFPTRLVRIFLRKKSGAFRHGAVCKEFTGAQANHFTPEAGGNAHTDFIAIAVAHIDTHRQSFFLGHFMI